MSYQWDFRLVVLDWRMWLDAAGNTLLVCAAALALVVPLGLLLAAARMFGPAPLRWAVIGYVDFMRTSALLILIIWFYFAFPMLFGINLSPFMAATVAIGLQTAAYFAELCRAGINAVDRGQWEAARAIGMRTTTMLRLIIFPQALRRIVPILFSLVAEVIKGSSLAAVITFGELTYAASQVSADTYRPIETYTVVALIYFVIIFTASRLASHFERRLGFQR